MTIAANLCLGREVQLGLMRLLRLKGMDIVCMS